MRLLVNTDEVELVAQEFGATMRQIDVARIRALNKSLRWARGRLIRALGAEARVVLKVIRQRVKLYKASRRDPSGRIWVGLEPLSANRLGKARQLKRGGVRAGRHLFGDAFLAKPPGQNNLTVFARTGDDPRKMTKGRYEGKKREPIEKVELDLDSGENRRLVDEWFDKVHERFQKTFVQEIKYEVVIKNA